MVLACLFTIELIIGGPGYWMVGNFSIRKLLFAANFAWFIGLWSIGRIRLGRGELLVVSALLALLLGWVVIIPLSGGPTQLSMALQDGSPLATAFLAVLYQGFFRRRRRSWQRFCTVATASLVFVAIANIALWCVGMSGDTGDFLAQGAALYWFTLGKLDLEPPLYVGLMPDGFFRAMWITGTLYLPALLYCIAARRKLGVLLFTAALLATYTRALWLAAVLGIVVAQALSPRHRRFIDSRIALAMMVVAVVGLSTLLLGSAVGDSDSVVSLLSARLGSTFSDQSANERFDQIGPLLEKWSQAPWLGNGFGAHASLVRSDDAPYSYELTVLALLMKMGVVGLLCVLVLLAGLWFSGWLASRSNGSARASAGLAAILAFSAAAATNPFLLNFVGMSALSFMIIRLHAEPEPDAWHIQRQPGGPKS